LTGFFLRIKRDGEYQNVEIDQMTEAELEDWAKQQREFNRSGGFRWAIGLATWIRLNVRESSTGPVAAPLPLAMLERLWEAVKRYDRIGFEGSELLEVMAEAREVIDAARKPKGSG
jgi:hypothetical protein